MTGCREFYIIPGMHSLRGDAPCSSKRAAARRTAGALLPNCWLAHGADTLRLVKELQDLCGGQGGYIEQTYHYVDPFGAADWVCMAEQVAYASLQRAIPLDRAAEAITHLARCDLDLIALGCGDGRSDVHLTQHLTRRLHGQRLKLHLLDISHPLLSLAYQHAAKVLRGARQVDIVAVQGNFHHLARYAELLYSPARAHRRRVIWMLGATFGNLENERRFVASSLSGFGPSDLLLLDIDLTRAPADDPAAIRASDPWLSPSQRPDWQEQAMAFDQGLLLRYVPGAREIRIATELGTGWCAVPGSYAVEFRAEVETSSGARKNFTVAHLKRYDPVSLGAFMRELGWQMIDGWRYGEEPGLDSSCALCLFRREG